MRLILEYGQYASSPYLRWDITLTEQMQNLDNCMVKGIRELLCKERHRQLTIFSLECSSLRGHLIFTNNIFSRLPRKRISSNPQCRGIHYVIVVSTYAGGKQPPWKNPWNSLEKTLSVHQRLTLSSGCWT